MTRDEARNILMLYRPDAAEEAHPQIAEALALAKSDAALAQWLEQHLARQKMLAAKFQKIPVPEGLKEQIISEQKAAARRRLWRRNALVAAAAFVVLLALAVVWTPPHPQDDTFALYRNRMISGALRGYSMDLVTNSPAAIRSYLTEKSAPADYVLPGPLQNAELTGCAVQSWHGAKVAMLCFRTGRPLPPDQPSDLWLFVVDQSSVKDAPHSGLAQFAQVNRLMTAVWSHDGKLYLLGTAGSEQAVRQYL
jgi:hypothetical protein